jgi:membrane protein required for colicin V production
VIATATTAAGTTTNWLDPTIVGIIAVSAFLGVWRGLIRSVAGFAGIILAALFAGKLAALVDPALKHAGVKQPPVNGGWTFVVAFIAIVVAVEIGANILVWVQRLMLLGWVDRLGGLIFGAARGVLLSMILLAGFAQFGSTDFNSAIKQGAVAVWLWQNVPSVTKMLPAGMRDSTIRLVHDKAPFLDQAMPLSTPAP